MTSWCGEPAARFGLFSLPSGPPSDPHPRLKDLWSKSRCSSDLLASRALTKSPPPRFRPMVSGRFHFTPHRSRKIAESWRAHQPTLIPR